MDPLNFIKFISHSELVEPLIATPIDKTQPYRVVKVKMSVLEER